MRIHKKSILVLLMGCAIILPFAVFAEEVTIPKWHLNPDEIGPSTLGFLIVQTASFATRVVGILAIVLLLYSGLKRITSAGSSESTGEADEIMWAALIGMMIAFVSVLGLQLINPVDLVTFQPITLTQIEKDKKPAKVEVALEETEDYSDPATRQRFEQFSQSIAGQDPPRPGQDTPYPNSDPKTNSEMPQARHGSNFLGYQSGVRGGSPVLDERLTAMINNYLNNRSENPNGYSIQVSSMYNETSVGTRFAGLAHRDGRAVDVVIFDSQGRKLQYSDDQPTNRPIVASVQRWAEASGFRVVNEYERGTRSPRRTGAHLHFEVARPR